MKRAIIIFLVAVVFVELTAQPAKRKKVMVYQSYSLKFSPEDKVEDFSKEKVKRFVKEIKALGIPEFPPDRNDGENFVRMGEFSISVTTTFVKHSELGVTYYRLRGQSNEQFSKQLEKEKECQEVKDAFLNQPSKLGLVLKLRAGKGDVRKLMIALSFLDKENTVPKFNGTRIISDYLPIDGNKAFFGYKGTKLDQYKSIIIGADKFAYMNAGMDRHENGMFKLIKSATDPNEYKIQGALSTHWGMFVIDENIKENVQLKIYQQIFEK